MTKLFISLLGIVFGFSNTPTWLILVMLILLMALFTDTCAQLINLFKKKYDYWMRRRRFYTRKRVRSEWLPHTAELPMIQWQ